MSVNKVILIGRLGQNPEIRYTPAGAPVVNFSIATQEFWMDKGGQKQEKTEWHRVVVWGKLAETCSQYLAKGRQVYLEGRLQTRQWQDKDGQTKYTTEINAQAVQFLGAPSQPNQAPSDRSRDFAGTEASSFGGPGSNGGSLHSTAAPMDTPFTEDDIPF